MIRVVYALDIVIMLLIGLACEFVLFFAPYLESRP